jgi:hypothetical protein
MQTEHTGGFEMPDTTTVNDTASSKYLLDYDAYVDEHQGEIFPEWADHYRKLAERADARVYAFIMQYIFM